MFLSKLLLYVMSCIMINNLRGMQVMRRFLFVLLYFVSVQFVWGQTMDVQWFVSAGGAAADHGNSFSRDSEGNIYVTGGFQKSSSFGESTVSSHGDTDIFFAKYDSNGRLKWLKQAGSDSLTSSSLSEYGTDILVVGGFVYVTGVFISNANFGSTVLRAIGSHDIFLAKYSLDGELVWAQSAGSDSQDIANSLSTDSFGNIYLTGSFQRECRFGNESLIARNSMSMFLAKYAPSGQLTWVKQHETKNGSAGKRVACIAKDCFVAADIENGISDNEQSVVLLKYDLDGRLIWEKDIIKNERGNAEDLLLTENSLYLTGSFFGNPILEDLELHSKGGKDMYLLEMTLDGLLQWGTSAGGIYMDEGKSLSTIANGKIVVGGNFQHSIEFDSVFQGEGADDIFLASFGDKGKLNWVKTIGGSAQDKIQDVEVDIERVNLLGHFRSSLHLGDNFNVSNGGSDIFISRIGVGKKTGFEEWHGQVSFPNPSSGIFKVYTQGTIQSFEINDSQGRKLKNVEYDFVDNSTLLVRVKNFKGVGIVRSIVAGKMYTSKIIVE